MSTWIVILICIIILIGYISVGISTALITIKIIKMQGKYSDIQKKLEYADDVLNSK